MFYFFFSTFMFDKYIMIPINLDGLKKNDAKKFLKIYMQVCFFQPLNYE